MNKEKIQWRNEMATLIEAMLGKYMPSDEFSRISKKQPFFEDSQKFVELQYQLRTLVATLRNLNRYSEIIYEKSSKANND